MTDDEANRMFYAVEDITAREILLEGRVDVPAEARSLIDLMKKYEESTQ